MPADRPPRELLIELYRAATAAVDPAPALRARLADLPAERGRRWILALGKAAGPTARAAVETLAGWGAEPAGGVVVAPALEPAPHGARTAVRGDHPEPGEGSLAAARALADAAARIPADDEVWVLLSGGATSLLAAPVDGVSPEELRALYALLLGSGAACFCPLGGGRMSTGMTAVRRRVERSV